MTGRCLGNELPTLVSTRLTALKFPTATKTEGHKAVRFCCLQMIITFRLTQLAVRLVRELEAGGTVERSDLESVSESGRSAAW